MPRALPRLLLTSDTADAVQLRSTTAGARYSHLLAQNRTRPADRTTNPIPHAGFCPPVISTLVRFFKTGQAPSRLDIHRCSLRLRAPSPASRLSPTRPSSPSDKLSPRSRSRRSPDPQSNLTVQQTPGRPAIWLRAFQIHGLSASRGFSSAIDRNFRRLPSPILVPRPSPIAATHGPGEPRHLFAAKSKLALECANRPLWRFEVPLVAAPARQALWSEASPWAPNFVCQQRPRPQISGLRCTITTSLPSCPP